MMFVDCPACLDQDGTVMCGLPAEIRCRFTMRSTEGPLDAAMIRCPAGHWFNGPIESLTWDGKNKHDPGTAPAASTAGDGSPPRTHDDRDSRGGAPLYEVSAGPGAAVRRPNCAPAYYLGRPAYRWIAAARHSRTASTHPKQAATGGAERTPPSGGGLLPDAGAGTACVTPATTSWPRR